MEPQVERALRELSDALASSQPVVRARQAREEVEGREATRIMLRDLESVQEEVLERARRGEQVPQELVERYQQVAQLAGYNPYLRELFQAETELAQMLDQVQKEILRAAGVTVPQEDPGGSPAATGQGTASEAPRVDPVRSRLWVPGEPKP